MGSWLRLILWDGRRRGGGEVRNNFSAAKDVELVQLQMITDDYRRPPSSGSSKAWGGKKQKNNSEQVSSLQKMKLFLLNGAL